MAEYRYLAFGLSIGSEIALPELAESSEVDTRRPDVTIRVGPVDASLSGARSISPGVVARQGAILLDYTPCRYLVTEGRLVTIQPRVRASPRDVRGYLLGSAIGAVLHQRGVLPLHANAIVGRDGAVAFAGPSGAGKSTIAALFHAQGWQVLCDDVCAITFDEAGNPQAWPGVARIKLWSDALAAIGRGPEGLERVWEGQEKFSLPLPPHRREHAARLERIYILREAGEATGFSATQLSGRAAFAAIMTNIYRWEFAAPLEGAETLFSHALKLSSSCQVFALKLPRAPGVPLAETDVSQLLALV